MEGKEHGQGRKRPTGDGGRVTQGPSNGGLNEKKKRKGG